MRSDIIERASVRNVSQGKDYALTLRKEHRGTYVWRTDAGTSVAFGRKCRAEFAEVLEIVGAEEAFSRHDSNFFYRVGETVRPSEPWCEDWTEECASGIHFYITRAEAEAH